MTISGADPDELVAHDHGRLLWNLALSGAQVRRAEQVAGEWQPDRLDLGGPPRALLVATDAPTAGVADLLAVLAPPVAPVTVLGSPQLPRWAGAADAALIVSLDGRHPRLVALVDQAARRGVSLAVIAPPGSPVAVAAGRAVVVGLAADTAVRAAGWAALGPALLIAGAWRLTAVTPGLLSDVAAALDDVAHRCRPGSDVVANPARALAEEFSESLPVVVGCGPLASVAAHRFAATLRLVGGVVATSASLPDEIAAVTALLAVPGGRREDDFFRDRVDEPVPGPRLVVIGDEGSPTDPSLGLHDAGVENEATERDAVAAAHLLHRYAEAAGVRCSTLAVPPGDPLVRFAAAALLGDFTAAYLALERGADPSAPRPGENP